MQFKTEVEKKGGLCTSPFVLYIELENPRHLGDSRMMYLWKGKLDAVPRIGAEPWGYLALPEQTPEELQAIANSSGYRVLKKQFTIETEPAVVYHPDREFQPYTGRQYIINVQDCYQLVREFYARELAIELKDYDSNAFWKDGGERTSTSMIEQLVSDGFQKVTDEPQEGDLIVMSYDAPPGYANHLAIWHQGKYLHHQPGRLSHMQEVSAFLTARTVCRLRYAKETAN